MPSARMHKLDPAFPATLFAEINPKGTESMMMIYQGEASDSKFRQFINKSLTDSQNKNYYPDHWIFRYDLPAGSRVIPAIRDSDGSFRTFHVAAQRDNIFPAQILPLRDIAFCWEQGIDYLLPAGRHDRLMKDPDYHSFLINCETADHTKQGYRSKDHNFHTVRAVDIESGILLYDLSLPIGREAYKSFMQHCADHFFKQDMNDLCSLSLYDVHCFFDPKTYLSKLAALNFNFNHLGRSFSLRDLNSTALFSRDMRWEGVPVKEYDMRPLSTSFVEFINGEQIRLPIYSDSLNIALLDQIARAGYPTQKPSPELSTFSPYIGRFKDIEDRMMKRDDPTDLPTLQRQAQARAKKILDTEFPGRRMLKDLEIIPSLEMNREPSQHYHKL